MVKTEDTLEPDVGYTSGIIHWPHSGGDVFAADAMRVVSGWFDGDGIFIMLLLRKKGSELKFVVTTLACPLLTAYTSHVVRYL